MMRKILFICYVKLSISILKVELAKTEYVAGGLNKIVDLDIIYNNSETQ